MLGKKKPLRRPEPLFERAITAPAKALDHAISGAHALGAVVDQRAPVLHRAREYWRMLGPGLTTGASDDDPSGIATYSQAGAAHGFHLLWLAPFTFPLMAVVQEMCARIGMATGRGLAANLRSYFPRPVLLTVAGLLFLANAFNIGADLGAMASAAQLLMPGVPTWVLLIGFTGVSLALQIFATYERYARYLKWLAMVLLAYVVAVFLVPNLNWGQVARSTAVPKITFTKESLVLIAAILGTTISPYLFFWQTSQEVEEGILGGQTTILQRKQSASPEAIKRMRVDVWSGMFLSNLVMYFIILLCGAVLHTSGVTEITTAAQAAAALAPLGGANASLLFTLGIVGTGLLAVPVLAGASSYALAESFGWKEGLYRNLNQAYAFYGVMILSMLLGLGFNFAGIDPVQALIASAVANALVAPVVLIPIVRLAASHKVMGRWVNHVSTTWIGWGVVGLMLVAGVGAIWGLL
jgi:NRAMP (natural resistance-associated macrophage protein)-like metal ion transporter